LLDQKDIAPVPKEVNPGIHDGTKNKMKRIKGASRESGLGSSGIPCSRIEISAIIAMQMLVGPIIFSQP
jgi:hypothetical protein